MTPMYVETHDTPHATHKTCAHVYKQKHTQTHTHAEREKERYINLHQRFAGCRKRIRSHIIIYIENDNEHISCISRHARYHIYLNMSDTS